jgi:hypothetical protein
MIRDAETKLLGKGEFESMALTSEGHLVPSHDVSKSGDSGREIVWDAIPDKKGNLVCATGHGGQLVRILDEDTTETVGKFSDPELTSLLRLDDGALLVAGAPSGTIYHVDSEDHATTFTRIDANWVWRMIQDEKGDIWVASGTDGVLYRLRGSPGDIRIDSFKEFKSVNLLDMWIDSGGHMGEAGMIYVAGQDPGWLYRLDPRSGAIEVMYNSQLEEIRGMAPHPDGLALALNPERSPSNMTLKMTLRMSGLRSMGPGNTSSSSQTDPEKVKRMEKAFTGSGQDHRGSAKSEIILLSREGFTKTLWTATDKPIHAIVRGPGESLLVSVGSNGRLFKVEPDGEVSMITDLREDYIIKIRPDKDGYVLACARNGLVYNMSGSPTRKGVYISRPVDGGLPVNWGHYYLHGRLDRGQKAEIAFRTSQHGETDPEYWTDWTRDTKVTHGEAVKMPDGPSRFIQYRLTLEQKNREDGGAGPRMEFARLYYIEPNAAPRVNQITVKPSRPKKGAAVPSKNGKPPQAPGDLVSSGSAKSGKLNPGVKDPGLQPDQQGTTRFNTMQFNVNWQVLDPNQDKLIYDLYYRSIDETAWKLIDDEIQSTKIPLSIGGIADGRYRFKVVASDELSNPPGKALKGEKISEEYIVDNTPPGFEKVTSSVNGRDVNLRVVLKDSTSILSSLQVDIDNGDVYPVFPVDGILDQLEEEFEFSMSGLEPGEHVATFNATDVQGNTSVKKSVFSVDED